MRVLFLYDFPLFGGGSGAYVKYLTLRLLERYKYELAIAAPDKEKIDPRIAHFYLKLPQIPVFIGRPGLESAKRYSDLTPCEIASLYRAFIDGTIKAVEKFRPNLIHVHHLGINAWAARFIRSVFGTKFIITSHGSCLLSIAKDRRYLRLSRDSLRAASAITVVSNDTRAKLLKMFGRDLSSKTRTIPGGIALSLFPLEKNVNGLRRELGIGQEKISLFTGRLILEKGVEYFVKAAKSINGQVLIAGGGPQQGHLEQIVKEKGLRNVRFLPFLKDQKEFIKLYYLADVFVSPAVWDEPLGLTIIEAMAAKRPVVVTRKGGVTLAVKDGVNGIFVRPRNSTQIAEAVNRLFANEGLRKRMGERARETVEAKFTWTKIAARFDRLYQKVMGNKKS